MKKICLMSLISFIFLLTLAFAGTDIVIENGIMKQVSSKEITIEILKQRFDSLKARKKSAEDALLKVNDDIQAFKDMITKAGIDWKTL